MTDSKTTGLSVVADSSGGFQCVRFDAKKAKVKVGEGDSCDKWRRVPCAVPCVCATRDPAF